LTEIAHALDVIARDDAVRGLIVTGAGEKAFVAGADINELAQMQALQAKSKATFGQQVFARFERLGKPSIAMINGFALGGGCELALACTLRTASSSAKLGLPEVSLGIIPGYGGTQRLARIVGKGRALEMILGGRMIDAAEAHRIGLANHVVPPSDLLGHAEEMARAFLLNGPVALRHALEAVGRGLEGPLAEGLQLEADLFGLTCGTKDMKEGMTAFLEKRKPGFRGA
jgi:enoyl-CoA hydratase